MRQTRPAVAEVGHWDGNAADMPPRATPALVRWWHSLVAPAEPPADASPTARDRARRGRLASTLLFGLLLVGLGALAVGFSDPDHFDGPLPGLFNLLPGAFAAGLAAALLNRRGHVNAAGVLMIVIADLPLLSITLFSQGGRLDVVNLTGFYPIIIAVLFAASILPPISVFPVALVNSLLVCAIILAKPHTPAFAASFDHFGDIVGTMGQPIGLELVVAIVSYLWITSTRRAIQRADLAEALAELERREVERTRELERGVRQLLAVHVELANGNFNVRAPMVRNTPLWQIGSSLNNLIARFARLAQADYTLHRTSQEARRLAEAIHVWREGRQPIWPTPSGTPLDEVLVALAGEAPWPSLAPPTASGRPTSRPLASDRGGPLPAPPLSPAPPRRPTARQLPPFDPAAELPPWLRPQPPDTDSPDERPSSTEAWPDLHVGEERPREP
ncbi:MAG: hypothetical protein IVW57_02695 [Ktedonobacterales bacterium]|nr:hypothetical protein [Ktedonobacterales bacterium]